MASSRWWPRATLFAPSSTHRSESDPRRATIKAALEADPDRSDREVARIAGVPPSSVGAARRALGLDRTARAVVRGGRSYRMEVGELARGRR